MNDFYFTKTGAATQFLIQYFREEYDMGWELTRYLSNLQLEDASADLVVIFDE